MIVAVSMRVVETEEYQEFRDAISHDWTLLLDSLGVTPVFVPNVLADPARYLRDINAKGLLLTGGENIGFLPPGGNGSPARDRTEYSMLGHAIKSGLPIFGTCRGLQFINAYFGGEVTPDLHAVGNHVNTVHSVKLISDPSGLFNGIKTIKTNSYHRQGVMKSGLAETLTAFALAGGDVVEGFAHHSAPIVAVQWHPERPNPGASLVDHSLLKQWVSRCV
jgi:putative glutamine amidotransferase